VLDDTNQDPLRAARWARENEGGLYDWQAILRFLLWVLPQKLSRGMCSEVCARMFGVSAEDAYLLDPRLLRVVVRARLL
jgi:hypothetical protein